MHARAFARPTTMAYCFSIRCLFPILALMGGSDNVQASLPRLMGRTCKQSMGSGSSSSACLQPGRTTQCSCTSRSSSLHSAMVRQTEPALPRSDVSRCETASWKLGDACRGTCPLCQMACLCCTNTVTRTLPEASFIFVYQALQRRVCLLSLTSIMLSSH